MPQRRFTKADLWETDGELWSYMGERAKRIARNQNKALELREEARFRIAIYGPGDFDKGYVTTVLNNCWKDMLRGEAKYTARLRALSVHLMDQEHSIPDRATPDLHEAAVALIRALPDTIGTAMRLRYLRCMSLEDTAAELKISPATVKSRCFMGRRIVRELLEFIQRLP